jgi:IS1 family transposase
MPGISIYRNHTLCAERDLATEIKAYLVESSDSSPRGQPARLEKKIKTLSKYMSALTISVDLRILQDEILEKT